MNNFKRTDFEEKKNTRENRGLKMFEKKKSMIKKHTNNKLFENGWMRLKYGENPIKKKIFRPKIRSSKLIKWRRSTERNRNWMSKEGYRRLRRCKATKTPCINKAHIHKKNTQFTSLKSVSPDKSHWIWHTVALVLSKEIC